LTDDELAEHSNHVKGVEEHLAKYREIMAPQSTKREIPQPKAG